MFSAAWGELYQLDRAQCGYDDQDFNLAYLRSAAVLLLVVTSGIYRLRLSFLAYFADNGVNRGRLHVACIGLNSKKIHGPSALFGILEFQGNLALCNAAMLLSTTHATSSV